MNRELGIESELFVHRVSVVWLAVQSDLFVVTLRFSSAPSSDASHDRSDAASVILNQRIRQDFSHMPGMDRSEVSDLVAAACA